MEFGFATVDAILSRINMIRADAGTAFAARLKHLQRLGFPEGVNTGRGHAAVYNIGHLCDLNSALQLIQLGYLPERAIVSVRKNDNLKRAYYLVAHSLEMPSPKRYVVGMTPSALAPLGIDALTEIENLLIVSDVADLSEYVKTSTMFRYAYFDLTATVDLIALHLEQLGISTRYEALSEIRKWGATYSGYDPEA